MFTLTKVEALRIQAEQVAWYNRNGDRPTLAAQIRRGINDENSTN